MLMETKSVKSGIVKSVAVTFSLALMLTMAGCDNDKSNNETKIEDASSTSATTTSTTPAPQMITIEHAQGTTAVKIDPQKVAVLNPATLDTMDALGIKVVAVTQTDSHLPSFLAKYTSPDYVNAGSLFEPNYEALSSLAPDLIIAGGRSSDAYDKLSEIAPTISLDLDSKNIVNSITQRTEQLGQIFNKQALAQQLIDQFKQKVADVKAKTENQGTALIILVTGGKMSAYGPGSRFGFIYDELGFKPATTFAQTGKHGNVINAEFLLDVDPDWLFVIDRDNAIGDTQAQSAQQVLDNELVHKTKVWQNDNIVYLDSSSLYIAGGLQTYSQLLDQISQIVDQN